MAKERGILFSTEMVAAILEDRKTQTRRQIKDIHPDSKRIESQLFPFVWLEPDQQKLPEDQALTAYYKESPYGKPGDRLYVRETWRIAGWSFDDSEVLVEYKDGIKLWMPMHDPNEDCMWLQDQIEKLEAKGVLEAKWGDDEEDIRYHFKKTAPWKPGIHMPKCFSRIWVEIDELKVERVQEISEEDAMAEGVEKSFVSLFQEWRYKDYIYPNSHVDLWWRSPISSFKTLWQSINGVQSWDQNPWTWAIGFKILSKEGETAHAKGHLK